MASQDALLLQSAGIVIVDNIIILACTTLFYGFYMLMMACLAHIEFRRGLSGPTLRMFAVALVIFASTTTYWIMFFITSVKIVTTALVNNPEQLLIERFIAANKVADTFGFAEIWLQSINFMLADLILVWRAVVLCSHRRVLCAVLMALLGGSAFTALLSCIFNVISSKHDKFVGLWVNAQLAGWILSIATNALATYLIAGRAWDHRSLLKTSNKDNAGRTRVESILILLVEGGVLYILLQIAFICLQKAPGVKGSSTDGKSVAAQSLLSACIIICGIYPTATVVLVALQHSIANLPSSQGSSTYYTSGPSRSRSITRLSFAQPPSSTVFSEPEATSMGLGCYVEVAEPDSSQSHLDNPGKPSA